MHPVLVYLATPFGRIPVYSYGVCLGLAVLAGWYLTLALAERHGRDAKTLADAFLVTLLGALVGARLLHVVAHPSVLRSFRSALALHTGGMMGIGAVAGGLLALVVHARVRKTRVLPLADFLAPAALLGHALVRIGCYLYGCCYGERLGAHAPSWLRALGTFPRVERDGNLVGSPAFLHQLASATDALSPGAAHAHPVHPTELYEAALAFVLFGLSLVLFRRRRFQGQTCLLALVGYALIRLAIEPLRGDPGRGFAMGLSYTQIGAFVILVYATLTYVNVRPASRRLPLPSRGGKLA